MQRKTFIKLSSAIMAAPLVSSIPDFSMQEDLQNWAGNLTYQHKQCFLSEVGFRSPVTRKKMRPASCPRYPSLF